MKNIIFIIICFCVACTSQKQISSANMTQSTLVYKTKTNYNNLVPILLSDDKTEIVMYPAPTDVYYQGKLALPTQLKQGYLLDNRGIGKNVAFIKLTYKEYSKLKKAPSLKELYTMIVDKEPLLEIYNCGNRENFSNLIEQLNQIIEEGKLTEYTKKN